jgi:anti-sigma regulatory factor (Ser/Thr protein kinase)
MHVSYEVKAGDFSNAGNVSSTVKSLMKQLGIAPQDVKRIIVALYEAEVNVVAHSYGGTISCEIDPETVDVVVADTGPGIPNLDLAMTEGYSTATPEVREMGFGAGMGLSNIRKNADTLTIDTGANQPTNIYMHFSLVEGAHHA